MLPLAVSFVPEYTAEPSFIGLGKVPISTRFPYDGATAASPASGTTGSAGTITPERSAVEAAAWGANFAAWVYVDLAASRGYASSSEFVAEFTARGIVLQGTANASAVDPSTGPFMQDLAGVNFGAGTVSNRPALNSGQQSPVESRVTSNITFYPSNDTTGTKTPKLAAIGAQIASGIQALQFDDPRGPAAYGGFRAHRSAFDIASQAADFSATALAGFPSWLSANTTSAQRTAVGLPSDPTGLDLKAWLITNKSSILYGADQVDGAAIDNYRFRTSVSSDESLRTIYLTWYQRYMRDDQIAYIQQVKAATAVPLSLNLYGATSQDYMTWMCRGSAASLWDFAISEVPPPYWSQISAYTVGSSNWQHARWAQCGNQYMQMAMSDHIGLRTICEHKPCTPNQAPARVTKQLMRQSIMQTVSEGHIPMVPIDIYLATSDARDQGVDVNGYRWWGLRADYKDCFDFIRVNAAVLDGYKKLAVVHVALSNDSYPFRDGARASDYDRYAVRWGALFAADVPVHLFTVGEPTGTLPEIPARASELAAPLIIRIQDDGEYMGQLGRLSGRNCRAWSTAAVNEAARLSPVSSSNPYVRASARYNGSRVTIHLHNYKVDSSGVPEPQTTTVRWNWGGIASIAGVARLGESGGSADFSLGSAQITLTEYAIVNFAVSA